MDSSDLDILDNVQSEWNDIQQINHSISKE
jgi:hypothetical protein